jgi:hypothetical protein
MTHHEKHERHEKMFAGTEPWKEKIRQHWPNEESGYGG